MFFIFKAVVDGIIADKRKNPKNEKKLNNFKVRVNIGLQMEKDFYFWVNLTAENGIFNLEKGELEDYYDLVLKATPEDLMFFCSRHLGF